MRACFLCGPILAFFFNAVSASNAWAGAWTLSQLIEQAEQVSPAIRSAQADMQALEGQRRQEAIYPNPRLAAEKAVDVKYSLVQGLEFPWARAARLAVTDEEVAAARIRLEQARLEISLNVKRAYYQLLAIRQRYALARENVGLLERLRATLPARYHAGLKNAAETLRVDLEDARTRNALRMIFAEDAHMSALLNSYLLLPSTNTADLQGSLEPGAFSGALEDLQARALQYDLELRLLDTQVRQEKARLDSVRKSRLATLDAGPNVSKALGESQYRVGIEASIGLPVWDRKQGSIQEASSREQSALYRASLGRQAIQAEVARLYQDYQSARERIEVFKRQGLLEQAVKMRTQAILAYQQGILNLTDMLDSLRTSAAAQEDYIQSLLESQLALIDLEKHAGGHL